MVLYCETLFLRDTAANVSKDLREGRMFSWLSHAQFYHEEGMIKIRVLDQTIDYGNEFLGSFGDPFLALPETMRSWSAAVTALRTRIAIFSSGPASVGKRTLAMQTARFLGKHILEITALAYPISDSPSIISVGNHSQGWHFISSIFAGVVQSGCLLLLHRLDTFPDTLLAAISQMMLTINHVMARDSQQLLLIGAHEVLSVNSQYGIFITSEAEHPIMPLTSCVREISPVMPNSFQVLQLLLSLQGFLHAATVVNHFQSFIRCALLQQQQGESIFRRRLRGIVIYAKSWLVYFNGQDQQRQSHLEKNGNDAICDHNCALSQMETRALGQALKQFAKELTLRFLAPNKAMLESLCHVVSPIRNSVLTFPMSSAGNTDSKIDVAPEEIDDFDTERMELEAASRATKRMSVMAANLQEFHSPASVDVFNAHDTLRTTLDTITSGTRPPTVIVDSSLTDPPSIGSPENGDHVAKEAGVSTTALLLPQPDENSALRELVKEYFESVSLSTNEIMISSCERLASALSREHVVLFLGPAFSGKSTCIKALASALYEGGKRDLFINNSVQQQKQQSQQQQRQHISVHISEDLVFQVPTLHNSGIEVGSTNGSGESSRVGDDGNNGSMHTQSGHQTAFSTFGPSEETFSFFHDRRIPTISAAIDTSKEPVRNSVAPGPEFPSLSAQKDMAAGGSGPAVDATVSRQRISVRRLFAFSPELRGETIFPYPSMNDITNESSRIGSNSIHFDYTEEKVFGNPSSENSSTEGNPVSREDASIIWWILDGPLEFLANAPQIGLAGPYKKVIFEVADVSNASPADISRFVVVSHSSKALCWWDLLHSWLVSLPVRFPRINANNRELLSAILPRLLLTGLDFLRRQGPISHMKETSLINSFLSILGSYLHFAFGHAAERINILDSCRPLLGMYVVSSFVWSFGSHVSQGDMAILDVLAREHISAIFVDIKLPTEGLLCEYRINPKTISWTPAPITLETHNPSLLRARRVPFGRDFFVHTSSTWGLVAVLQNLIECGMLPEVVGSKGCGKSALVAHACLDPARNSKDGFKHIFFDALSQSDFRSNLRRVLHGKHDELPWNLRPVAQERNFHAAPSESRSVMFVDDINCDTSESASLSFEFLRQTLAEVGLDHVPFPCAVSRFVFSQTIDDSYVGLSERMTAALAATVKNASESEPERSTKMERSVATAKSLAVASISNRNRLACHLVRLRLPMSNEHMGTIFSFMVKSWLENVGGDAIAAGVIELVNLDKILAAVVDTFRIICDFMTPKFPHFYGQELSMGLCVLRSAVSILNAEVKGKEITEDILPQLWAVTVDECWPLLANSDLAIAAACATAINTTISSRYGLSIDIAELTASSLGPGSLSVILSPSSLWNNHIRSSLPTVKVNAGTDIPLTGNSPPMKSVLAPNRIVTSTADTPVRGGISDGNISAMQGIDLNGSFSAPLIKKMTADASTRDIFNNSRSSGGDAEGQASPTMIQSASSSFRSRGGRASKYGNLVSIKISEALAKNSQENGTIITDDTSIVNDGVAGSAPFPETRSTSSSSSLLSAATLLNSTSIDTSSATHNIVNGPAPAVQTSPPFPFISQSYSAPVCEDVHAALRKAQLSTRLPYTFPSLPIGTLDTVFTAIARTASLPASHLFISTQDVDDILDITKIAARLFDGELFDCAAYMQNNGNIHQWRSSLVEFLQRGRNQTTQHPYIILAHSNSMSVAPFWKDLDVLMRYGRITGFWTTMEGRNTFKSKAVRTIMDRETHFRVYEPEVMPFVHVVVVVDDRFVSQQQLLLPSLHNHANFLKVTDSSPENLCDIFHTWFPFFNSSQGKQDQQNLKIIKQSQFSLPPNAEIFLARIHLAACHIIERCESKRNEKNLELDKPCVLEVLQKEQGKQAQSEQPLSPPPPPPPPPCDAFSQPSQEECCFGIQAPFAPMSKFRTLLEQVYRIHQSNSRILSEQISKMRGIRSHFQRAESIIESIQQDSEQYRPEYARVLQLLSNLRSNLSKTLQSLSELQISRKGLEEEMHKAEIPLRELQEQERAEFERVKPLFEEALKAIHCLRKEDLIEMKTYVNPPAPVMLAIQPMILLFRNYLRKIDRNLDPRLIMATGEPQWLEAKLILSRDNVFEEMIAFPKDDIPDSVLDSVGAIVTQPQYDPALLRRGSQACECICLWVRAVYAFGVVWRHNRPLRINLQAIMEHVSAFKTAVADKKSSERRFEET